MSNDQEVNDWCDELDRISTKINEYSRDLRDDKYAQARPQIKSKLEELHSRLGTTISQIK